MPIRVYFVPLNLTLKKYDSIIKSRNVEDLGYRFR